MRGHFLRWVDTHQLQAAQQTGSTHIVQVRQELHRNRPARKKSQVVPPVDPLHTGNSGQQAAKPAASSAFMCSDTYDICCCETVYLARSHLTELHMQFMALTFLLKIATCYRRFQ